MRQRKYYYDHFKKELDKSFPSDTDYYEFKKVANFIIRFLKKRRKYQEYSEYYVRRHLEKALSDKIIIASTQGRYMRKLEIITFICYSFPDIPSIERKK
jgi:hypothetical protein